MAFDRRDYAGETDRTRYREYQEELEQLALEREENARAEIIACELADRMEASEVAEPIAIAVGGWLRAVTREYTRRAA